MNGLMSVSVSPYYHIIVFSIMLVVTAIAILTCRMPMTAANIFDRAVVVVVMDMTRGGSNIISMTIVSACTNNIVIRTVHVRAGIRIVVGMRMEVCRGDEPASLVVIMLSHVGFVRMIVTVHYIDGFVGVVVAVILGRRVVVARRINDVTYVPMLVGAIGVMVMRLDLYTNDAAAIGTMFKVAGGGIVGIVGCNRM